MSACHTPVPRPPDTTLVGTPAASSQAGRQRSSGPALAAMPHMSAWPASDARVATEDDLGCALARCVLARAAGTDASAAGGGIVRQTRIAALQRTIDPEAVQDWYERRRRPKMPFLYGDEKHRRSQRRDHHQLLMLTEELERRYPGQLPSWQHVAQLVDTLNRDSVITMAHIRELLAALEIEHELPETYTRKDMVRAAIRRRYPGELPARELLVSMIQTLNLLPQPWTRSDVEATIRDVAERHEAPSPAPRNIPLFIDLMEDRRGAYKWRGTFSDAFTDWVNSASPLRRTISIRAKLNCWEAVLLAAAHAGLLAIDAIRQYRGDPFALLSSQGQESVLDQSQRANAVRSGDLIALEYIGNKVFHVVAAIGEDQADFAGIPIMSLWGKFETGTFTKSTLGDLLDHANFRVIRYFRF